MNKYMLKRVVAGILAAALLSITMVLGYLSGINYAEKQAAEEAAAEEVVEPVVEPVIDEIEAEVEVEKTKYFDVPLDRDLQDHIFAECEKYDVDPALVVAMIQKESTFNADAIGDGGNSLGLMQIQPRWHQERMAILGCDNLLNPYQNVTCGITIIDELLEKGKGLEWALMCYNGGSKYANGLTAQGMVSGYALSVMAYRDALVMA